MAQEKRKAQKDVVKVYADSLDFILENIILTSLTGTATVRSPRPDTERYLADYFIQKN